MNTVRFLSLTSSKALAKRKVWYNLKRLSEFGSALEFTVAGISLGIHIHYRWYIPRHSYSLRTGSSFGAKASIKGMNFSPTPIFDLPTNFLFQTPPPNFPSSPTDIFASGFRHISNNFCYDNLQALDISVSLHTIPSRRQRISSSTLQSSIFEYLQSLLFLPSIQVRR